jgi:RNA polymerase sigma-70 factor, ECF subfamily
MDDSSGSARLSELFAAACASRPDLNIDEASFKDFLRARPARLEPAALSHAGDLALVFACERGDASAMRVLENEHLARLGDLLPVRYRGEASEVAQILRDRLLVPDATGKMKISEFSGRGDLRSWLRVAAVRIAINLERRHKREVTLREEDHALGDRAVFDLELDHLKRRYSREFKEAFTAALGALEPRTRNILRQHYLDALTMETIAGIYRVHRITVVRWMDQARTELARETRRELSARLNVDKRELESILRLIESQLDVTLRAFLQSR